MSLMRFVSKTDADDSGSRTGPTNLVGMKVDFDIKGRGPDPIVRSGKKVTARALEALRKANIGEVEIDSAQIEGAFALSRYCQHRERRSNS